MKIKQLAEIENVKNADRTLKNLLKLTKTEIGGLGLLRHPSIYFTRDYERAWYLLRNYEEILAGIHNR